MLNLACAFAAYVVNASWEVALLAGAAWLASRWLRRCGPEAEHRVWVAALVMGIAMPMLPVMSSLWVSPLPAAGAGSASIRMAAAAGTGSLGSGVLGLPVWLLAGLAIVYGCSVLWASARLLSRMANTRSLLAASRAVELPAEKALLWEHARRAFFAGDVVLRRSDRLHGIAAMGWRRPVILVGADFVEPCSGEEFLSAMGHELAHLERRDPLRHLLCEAAAVLLAFHPLSWWMKTRIAQTREMVCDKRAVERLVEPKVYRQSLLRLAQRMLASRATALPALGLFEGNALEERMMRMKTKSTLLSGPARAALVMASVLLLVLTAASGALAKGVAADQGTSYGKVYHPGPGVTNPVLVYAPDPEYSQEARRAKYQGICVMGLIVDAEGNPQRVHVVRTLGMGLDAKALEAVRKYRFKPALHHGKPVAVAIRIEVNFKVY
jgi:TonB family protein